MIHFAHPYFWNGLFVVVALAAALILLTKLRRKVFYRFGDKRLSAITARSFCRRRFVIKEVLIVSACLFAVLALVRPQWGFEWREVKHQGLDIILAVDVSKSMLTEDVKPNRLERAKFAIKDLVKQLKGDRLGLVAFSGDAFLMCPLTSDYSGFLLSLEDLGINSIPRGGTDMGRVIQEALTGYKDVPSRYKSVVILTDGENWEGDPVSWAKAAEEKKVRIYTVGIGTREGELVRVVKESGEAEFVKDPSGNFVKSRLNEGLLKDVAAITGGAYVRSSGAELGLDYIYENYLSHLEKRDIESKMEQRYHEQFQIPLFLALCFLVLETWLVARREE